MSECKWADQFPNFPQVRINNEFPWVPYMAKEQFFTDGWLDVKKVSETLFPSVTIISNQDQKSPQVFIESSKTVLYKTEFDDFKDQAATDGYLISPEALDEMETHFLTNDYLIGVNIIYQRQDIVNIDITTDDQTNIKNRLYDLISLFLIGHGNTALKNDLDIGILDHTVSGNRSGSYNRDFGRVLRGATIGFNVDYKISQVFYDLNANVIDDIIINHTVGG